MVQESGNTWNLSKVKELNKEKLVYGILVQYIWMSTEHMRKTLKREANSLNQRSFYELKIKGGQRKILATVFSAIAYQELCCYQPGNHWQLHGCLAFAEFNIRHFRLLFLGYLRLNIVNRENY